MVELRLFAVAGVMCVLGGCGHEPTGPGTVVGALPLCYGPGPDANLWPDVTIEVRRDGHVVSTERFVSDNQHRTYRLTLTAGDYELTTRELSIGVRVRAGSRSRADFPSPGCL